jgi:cell division protein FtsB
VEELEERNQKRIEGLKAENSALLERIYRLESGERRWTGALEETLKRQMEAVKAENEALKAENAALLTRVDELERTEKVPLPPVGLGILGFLKQRHYIVQITVSSQIYGSTDTLLTDDENYWASQNVPNSWIQWTITGGLKAIISSVKIRGVLSERKGVADFTIGGSDDSAEWTTIIDSKTCPTTFEDFVTQAEALPQPQRPFSIIRLTQTGPRYLPGRSPDHILSFCYVDFGGKILFPAK